VQVNQRANGGVWNLLGTFSMTPGQSHRVVLTAQGDGQVIADAVAITPVDAANRAIWTPTLPSTRTYNVYARWHANYDRATNATFTVYHAGGTTAVQANQQLNNASWVLLGSFTMGPGQNHRVELSDIGDASKYVIADAVAFSPADSPNRAIWTPALSQRDDYDIYGWWHANTDRATDAPYTIFREGGTTLRSIRGQSGFSAGNAASSSVPGALRG
jgi:hypothetical protein